MENLAELQTQLEARNFKVLVQRFELLDFKQQLELVARTDVLIGVHGAALSFIPFLASKALVVELLP
jgi:capsular polysaccharide biosynthesis protein